MLYLVRKLDQSIIINNNIHIKIVEINKNSVKLGFKFPNGFTVLREEIFNAIAQENVEALKSFHEYELEKN